MAIKIFSDVLKLESYTIMPQMSHLSDILCKNVGLIQINDPFNHKTWSLIDNVLFVTIRIH